MTVHSDEPLRLKPSARLQRYLGQELIADPNLAVIEFVKNAYDAGASHVFISFRLLTSTSLLIADDGIGMTFEEFAKNWMQPGYSHKSPEAPAGSSPRPHSKTHARKLARARMPVGEKGLGRLAAGRLGKTLEVFTRATPDDPWLHVRFDWAAFDDMSKSMEDIEIPHDFTTEPPADAPYAAGTIVVISDLRQKWSGKVRGRPARGRSNTRLGRLRQDLEFLVRPLDPAHTEFEITLDADAVDSRGDMGRVTPRAALDSAAYTYSFSVTRDPAGGAKVERRVTRSEEIAKVTGQARSQKLTRLDEPLLDDQLSDSPGGCGPFTGVFLYNPPQAAKRAEKTNPFGVLLYRDGVLVEPYGLNGDDWVGVAQRKAVRQGHAAIQPNNFSGYVSISREENAELLDMSNRLGLIQNDAADEFVSLVKQEFRAFEALVYEEYVEPQWDTAVKKAAARATESVEIVDIFLRSLTHSLRQPIGSLGLELANLSHIANRPEAPEDLRTEMNSVIDRAKGHVARADDLIKRVLELHVPEFERVSVGELLRQVVEATKPEADRCGVHIEVALEGLDNDVLVPAQLVVQALNSLVENAIEAERPDGTSPSVLISVETHDKDSTVVITDNGSGIKGAKGGASLRAVKSTKGRPANGLSMVELLISVSRGRAAIGTTGAKGTRFEVTLPSRVEGVRSRSN